MKPFKIKYIDIACFFAILFPIMPSYFEMGGISIINILCVFVILLGLLGGVTRNIGCVSTDKIIICVWVLWETIICFFHGSIIGAVVNLLYIIAVIFVAKSINTFEKIDKIIDCIIYVAGIISIFGLIESLTGFNVFSLLNTSGLSLNYNPPRFGLTRIISSSGHAIEYCLYCMMCMTLTFYRIINMKKSKKKRMFVLIYCLVFVNAVLTLSRFSLICLLICQIAILYASGFNYFLKTMFKVLIGVVFTIALISVFVPEVRNAIQMILYMFLAIFSENYKTLIASSFGTDNLSAFGNRFDLYGWVWNDMKGHYFLGMGPNVEFNHAFTEYSGIYSWTTMKHSIEVNYLSILWNYGIVTLIFELICIIKIVMYELRSKRTKFEGRLSFGKTCGILSICYIISWFSIAQGTEYKLFILITALFFSYRRLSKNRRDEIKID